MVLTRQNIANRYISNKKWFVLICCETASQCYLYLKRLMDTDKAKPNFNKKGKSLMSSICLSVVKHLQKD